MIYDGAMKLSCPNCGATYDVPENAIGPSGRKIRCRACDTSWFEPARVAVPPPLAPAPPPVSPAPAATPPWASGIAETTEEPPVRRKRGPWLLLALVVLVVILGSIAATVLMGPQQVASRLGIGERHVPLGIAITREPDWRMIAGGSQLFAVSGRVWNPTNVEQPVPDIRAELRNAQGKTVYAWTITRPVPRLAPGAAVSFEGAAVDVPPSSSNVSVTFAGTGADR
ncbi:zinc-ribbon domain-containing protein [Sphingomonas crusticola]|uniref:zinc-ribbon domain-containing protein n=1 Tax=Sphingomonas crusticola TaxID=1697973 RepID=UPI000E21F510|nr:zinc-ribbon domain-containing protein [Sphingomonas crusticola]